MADDTVIILSASEARRRTEENVKKYCTKELCEINKRIAAAIDNKEFSITGDGWLQPETRRILEKAQYKVEMGTQYNESYYSISW
jgi:hypothetical protein